MERTDSSASSCRGMTLIELLLVMAILSVVMLAITSLFIPMQRSTVVQTQVTDVQANLRLAVNVLSQDLLTAGFLVAAPPVIFESGLTDDPIDFTIRTRLVGRGFGRVGTNPGPASDPSFGLTRSEMYDHFPEGSLVRLYNPVAMRELDENTTYDETTATATQLAAHAYEVTDNDGSSMTLDTNGIVVDVDRETVVVAVKDAAQLPLQTIRYRFADTDGDGNGDALLRIVNGTTQFLAREVSDVVFSYDYTPGGKVQRIDITLTGQTQALVANDAIAGAKTRALRTSVNLRNVF